MATTTLIIKYTQWFESSLQWNKIFRRAERAVDLIVIRYVVAEICHGRFENGRQPNAIHSYVFEMLRAFFDPCGRNTCKRSRTSIMPSQHRLPETKVTWIILTLHSLTFEISHPVAVAILERSRIYLIENSGMPPVQVVLLVHRRHLGNAFRHVQFHVREECYTGNEKEKKLRCAD